MGKIFKFDALLHIGNLVKSVNRLIGKCCKFIYGVYPFTARCGVLGCIKNSKGRKQPANTTEQHVRVHFVGNQACVQNATNKETVRTWICKGKD